MKLIFAVVLLGMLQSCLAADRNARLFFATISSSTSTSTSTATLTTTSICFTSTSTATLTGCTSGKKKREAVFEESMEDVGPSRVERSDTVFPSDEGLTSNSGRHFRDARLFLLGTSTSTVTATATSTTTTYKATLSLTLNCSPSNLVNCG